MPLRSVKLLDTACLQKPAKDSPLNLFNMGNQKTCSCFQAYHTYPYSPLRKDRSGSFAVQHKKRMSPFSMAIVLYRTYFVKVQRIAFFFCLKNDFILSS